MAEIYQLVIWELQNKARNELRRVFGVVWGITSPIYQRLKIWDLHGPDMAMTSSTTSEKNPYFSEILETTRNTIQKTVCQYLLPVSRKLWQKLYQLEKNWPKRSVLGIIQIVSACERKPTHNIDSAEIIISERVSNRALKLDCIIVHAQTCSTPWSFACWLVVV